MSESLDRFIGALDDEAYGLEMRRPSEEFGDERDVAAADRRRGLRRDAPDIDMLTLVRTGDVLRWQEGAAPPRVASRRRRAEGAAPASALTRYRFKRVEASQVGEFLDDLDLRFNRERGLRRWTDGKLEPIPAPPASGKVLLLLHGLAGSSADLVAGLDATTPGRELLKSAQDHYKAILTLDYPTLSTSPFLNALDLARRFATSKAEVDVIGHGSGGLVVRWWWEILEPNPRSTRRAILVGAPLMGTSLTSASRLRGGLDLLTNAGTLLTQATTATNLLLPFPFAPFVLGLMKLITSITSLGARTPLLDAAVAMVPGLSSGAREATNHELRRLRDGARPMPAYHVIQSDFEPDDPSWRFWRHFSGRQLASHAADVVFPAGHDLVVDTESMTELGSGVTIAGRDAVCSFSRRERVHHFGYFAKPKTLRFIRKTLSF